MPCRLGRASESKENASDATCVRGIARALSFGFDSGSTQTRYSCCLDSFRCLSMVPARRVPKLVGGVASMHVRRSIPCPSNQRRQSRHVDLDRIRPNVNK